MTNIEKKLWQAGTRPQNELRKAYLRYEALRNLAAQAMHEIADRISRGENLDELIDQIIEEDEK